MFAKTSLFVILLVAYASAAPPVSDVLQAFVKEFKDALPTELVEAYKSLSDEDKAILKEVFTNYKQYKTEADLIAALKQKSPELGAKAEKFYTALQKKIEGLSPKPKEFVQNAIAKAKEFHAQHVSGEKITIDQLKALVQEQETAYQALSDESKEELKKTFPKITAFLQNDKIKALLKSLLEKN